MPSARYTETVTVATITTAIDDTGSAAAVTNHMSTITIDKNTHSDLEKASKLIGLDEQELADRAIVHYLHSLRDEIELAEEFEAWDRASDEALVNMERELTNGA